MGIVETLRQYDVFPKPLDDFRIRTASGAAVSVLSLAVIGYLFLSEFFMFMTPVRRARKRRLSALRFIPSSAAQTYKTELVVDSTRENQNVNIFFDLTFPHMLSLDAVDISKQHKTNVNDHITKTRIMPDGTKADSHNAKMGTAITHEAQLKGGSGSGPGSGSGSDTGSGSEQATEGECCNTCDEVKAAYRSKGWAFDPSTEIEQCKAEIMDVMERERGQGCRLHGYVQVKRVGGQFIIAPSNALQHASEHVHDVMGFTLQRFNATHSIDRLQFTQANVLYPPSDAPKQPLEGTRHVMEDPGMFQYFVHVIPTERKYRSTSPNSYHYSASTHVRRVAGADHGGLPGVYINYDLSPIMMVESVERAPLGHFLTSLCAILGGVFTVMGMLDRLVYVAVEWWQKIKKQTDLLGRG